MAGSSAGRGRRGARPLPPGARLAGPRGSEFPVGRRPRGAGVEEGGAGAALPGRTRAVQRLRGRVVAPSDISRSAEAGTGTGPADPRPPRSGSRAARPRPALSLSGSRRSHPGPRRPHTSLTPAPTRGFGTGLTFLSHPASPRVLGRGSVP